MNNSRKLSDCPAGTGQLTDRVMQLFGIMEELVTRGKQASDVTPDDWSPLAELVTEAEFERIGPFHDALDWTAYKEMLTQWVNHSEGWYPVIKRVTEAPGVVYVQCEEMLTRGDTVYPFYSLSMYEFDDAMKIRRLHVYMQQEMQTGQEAG